MCFHPHSPRSLSANTYFSLIFPLVLIWSVFIEKRNRQRSLLLETEGFLSLRNVLMATAWPLWFDTQLPDIYTHTQFLMPLTHKHPHTLTDDTEGFPGKAEAPLPASVSTATASAPDPDDVLQPKHHNHHKLLQQTQTQAGFHTHTHTYTRVYTQFTHGTLS